MPTKIEHARWRSRLLRLWLFARIVWRKYEGERLRWRVAWSVTGCIYPETPGA